MRCQRREDARPERNQVVELIASVLLADSKMSCVGCSPYGEMWVRWLTCDWSTGTGLSAYSPVE